MPIRQSSKSAFLILFVVTGVYASEVAARWSDEEFTSRMSYVEAQEIREERLQHAAREAQLAVENSRAMARIRTLQIGLPLTLPPKMQRMVDEQNSWRRTPSMIGDHIWQLLAVSVDCAGQLSGGYANDTVEKLLRLKQNAHESVLLVCFVDQLRFRVTLICLNSRVSRPPLRKNSFSTVSAKSSQIGHK